MSPLRLDYEDASPSDKIGYPDCQLHFGNDPLILQDHHDLSQMLQMRRAHSGHKYLTHPGVCVSNITHMIMIDIGYGIIVFKNWNPNNLVRTLQPNFEF